MSNETNATNAFIALLTGGGVIAAVNENATLISICIAAIGLIMGLFFHILTVLHRKKVEERSTKEYKERIREELIKELFNKESDGKG